MTSRKRNKGRDRKAKKAALEAEQAALEVERMERERGIVRNRWKSWARGVDLNVQSVECNHGIDLMIPDDNNHPVTIFIDDFCMHIANNANMHMGQYLRDTFTTHQEVWNNESYREMAMNILIRMGTNFMLNNDNEGPRDVAKAIVALENYDGSGDLTSSVLYNRVAAVKVRDINGGDSSAKRDMLKFFRKRINCKCLKVMHLEARKTLPKLGMCDHCGDSRERALLMVCSRCTIAQYCSRNCQVADWSSRHKGYCKEWVGGAEA